VRNFNIKATPSCTGIGCEDDPVLTLAEFDTTFTCRRPGEGRIVLQSTVRDPLGDLEVQSVRSAMYLEADIQASCRPLARLPADKFLPYLYGRQDYWPALSTEGTA
jgi:acetoacetate decarboxylase